MGTTLPWRYKFQVRTYREDDGWFFLLLCGIFCIMLLRKYPRGGMMNCMGYLIGPKESGVIVGRIPWKAIPGQCIPTLFKFTMKHQED